MLDRHCQLLFWISSQDISHCSFAHHPFFATDKTVYCHLLCSHTLKLKTAVRSSFRLSFYGLDKTSFPNQYFVSHTAALNHLGDCYPLGIIKVWTSRMVPGYSMFLILLCSYASEINSLHLMLIYLFKHCSICLEIYKESAMPACLVRVFLNNPE